MGRGRREEGESEAMQEVQSQRGWGREREERVKPRREVQSQACMSLSNTSYLLGCHRGGRVDLPPAAQRETVARHTPHPLTNWLADIRGEQHNLTFSGTCTRHVYN